MRARMVPPHSAVVIRGTSNGSILREQRFQVCRSSGAGFTICMESSTGEVYNGRRGAVTRLQSYSWQLHQGSSRGRGSWLQQLGNVFYLFV